MTEAGESSAVFKLVVFVPDSHLEQLKQALFNAGAGRQGNYSDCCWQILGQGQFRPLEGSRPALGERGNLEEVAEWRLETLVAAEDWPAVREALRRAHPYESPAFDLIGLLESGT